MQTGADWRRRHGRSAARTTPYPIRFGGLARFGKSWRAAGLCEGARLVRRSGLEILMLGADGFDQFSVGIGAIFRREFLPFLDRLGI